MSTTYGLLITDYGLRITDYGLLHSIHNPSFCFTVGAHFYPYPITQNNFNKMNAHLSRKMGNDLATGIHFHSEHRIGQGFNHYSFSYHFFFLHIQMFKYRTTYTISQPRLENSGNLDYTVTPRISRFILAEKRKSLGLL